MCAARIRDRDAVIAASSHCGVLWQPDQQQQQRIDDSLLTAESVNWRVIVAGQFTRPEHINALELRAVSTALRWVLKSPDSCRHRLMLLSDSQVAIGALTKGRSSAHALLCRVRPINAMLLAAGIQLFCRWIPSASNPADEPSRRYSI